VKDDYMIWKEGDIWIWYKMGNIIVVPTNAGYRKDGSNVMGAGIAKQAAVIYPDLPEEYGKFCQGGSPNQYFPDKRLVLVQTKSLNKEKPYLSWKQPSSIEVVIDSLKWLQISSSFFPSKVYVPILGSGNGGLDRGLVRKHMDALLTNEKFIGVDYENLKEDL